MHIKTVGSNDEVWQDKTDRKEIEKLQHIFTQQEKMMKYMKADTIQITITTKTVFYKTLMSGKCTL